MSDFELERSYQHFRLRLYQRYRIRIGRPAYQSLCDLVSSHEIGITINVHRDGSSWVAVRFEGLGWVPVVLRRGVLLTVLPPESLSRWRRELPEAE